MPELTLLGDVNGPADDDQVPLYRPGATVLNNMTVAELRDALLKNAAFNKAFLAWFASLPTSPPLLPGVAWNNGGTVAVS